MNTLSINAKLLWTFFQEKEAGRWIAECDALNLVIEGKTHAEMTERIHHAQGMMFKHLLGSGELDSFLRNHHWQQLGALPSNTDDAVFDVPIELIQQQAGQHGSTRSRY